MATATLTPTTAPVNTMPAAALGTNPSTYSSYFPAPTASAGLAESATASKDAYVASRATEADQLTQVQDAGTSKIKELLGQLGVSAVKKADTYESEGLNQNKRDIDNLTSEMESTGRNFDKQISTVQANNPSGQLATGVNIDVNRLTQQKASTLADLAIVLNAKTRNYDTAKSIIDTKADAETEDLKTRLQGLQYFYDKNESNLSDDKKVILQQKIDAADKEYDTAKTLRTQIGNIQLEAAKKGAPISVVKAIGASGSLEDAIGASAGYVVNKGTGSGFDAYTDTERRVISRANLGGASEMTKAAFLATPPAFQDAFTRNGTGFSYPNPTPQDLITSLSSWEKENKSDSTSQDIANIAAQLRQQGK